MAPEQAQGQTHKIDSRTDTYALGVVLYELLTGRQPFLAKTSAELWTAIVSQSPRPLRTIDPSIPIALERICLRALAKDPAERFSTAGDMASELRAYATASHARPPWARVAGAAGVLAAVLGLLALWGGPRRSLDRPTDAPRPSASGARPSDAATGQQTREAPSPAGSASVPAKPEPPIPATAVRLDLTGRNLTNEDYLAVGRCAGLRELILADTPTTDARLTLLENCQSLRQLDLSGTQVTDKGTDSLEKLTGLEDLSLARTQITGDALDDLQHNRLRRLDLSGTIVNSEGIKDLADGKEAAATLESLDLSRTPVDDAAVQWLAQLRRLTQLKIQGTNLTAAAIEQLRTALPRCKIDSGNASSN